MVAVVGGAARPPSPARAALTLGQHAQCLALSGILRGKLCEQLTRRPARHAAHGTFLYLTGEPATSLYFVRRGLIKTSRVAPDGRELILHLHRPGEIFGELCFCTGERREQAAALEASEVVEILRDDLLAQLLRNPDAMLALIAVTCERLADAQSRLESVSFEPTMERLVRTLLRMADTLGEAAPEGTHIAHYITQEALAQLIAARREVVSGLLNRLRDQGLIDYPRKGRIRVQRQALETYLRSLNPVAD
jgi:CRP/FNR family transcriptional regulator, cyclic AMP receptor protein